MIPNMNPRMMKQAMKRLGIQQQEIDATEVIIRTDDREIIISDPQVSKINMGGQETFQITGDISEKDIDSTPDISEDDVKTVVDQTGADEEKVRQVLAETKGDLAEAIMQLKGSDSE